MNNKKGFTLTEILLAVMIVGVIGIALAALTTAAVQEGGIGRTKAVLRGQLSMALRQLRQDVLQASSVSIEGDGTKLTLKNEHPLSPDQSGDAIVYTFQPGNITGGGGGKIGGEIRRNNESWLQNVKQISSSSFVSPQFKLEEDVQGGGIESRLRVRIIVEVNSKPVVNDVVDETFVLPHGYAIQEVLSN